MTKLVQPGSIEHGIREALRYLGDDGVSQALEAFGGYRKSASLLRKCANPDDPRHQIQLRDAIALDRACVERGTTPPMLQAYQAAVQEVATGPGNGNADLCHLALAIGAAAGAISEAVLRAEDCNAEACDHGAAVQCSLQELEAAVGCLRRAIQYHSSRIIHRQSVSG